MNTSQEKNSNFSYTICKNYSSFFSIFFQRLLKSYEPNLLWKKPIYFFVNSFNRFIGTFLIEKKRELALLFVQFYIIGFQKLIHSKLNFWSKYGIPQLWCFNSCNFLSLRHSSGTPHALWTKHFVGVEIKILANRITNLQAILFSTAQLKLIFFCSLRIKPHLPLKYLLAIYRAGIPDFGAWNCSHTLSHLRHGMTVLDTLFFDISVDFFAIGFQP